LTLIFPVQMSYIFDSQTETYMYYFILPGFDVFRLCTPIELPIVDPAMCKFNFFYVKKLIEDYDTLPRFVQADVLSLMNRCRYGFTNLQEIRHQVSKSTALFNRLFISTHVLFTEAALAIQRWCAKIEELRVQKTQLLSALQRLLEKKRVLVRFVSKVCKPVMKNTIIKKKTRVYIKDWVSFRMIIRKKLKAEQDAKDNKAAARIQNWIRLLIQAKEQRLHSQSHIPKGVLANKNSLEYLPTKKKWWGFNNNDSLKRLILAVGETLDILRLQRVQFRTDNYWRVKECIGKICEITQSRQYIKFCRTQSETTSFGSSESQAQFLACYAPGKTDNLTYLKEAVRLSKICKNKWSIYLINNFKSIEMLV